MDVNTAKTSPPSNMVGAGDSLVLYSAPGTFQRDLVAAPLSVYIDMPQEESLIIWKTDEFNTAHGFTLIFQPNYPEVMLHTGTPMAQGASGVRLVPVRYRAGQYRVFDCVCKWVDHDIAHLFQSSRGRPQVVKNPESSKSFSKVKRHVSVHIAFFLHTVLLGECSCVDVLAVRLVSVCQVEVVMDGV